MEELIALLLSYGVTLSDMHDITYGEGINIVRECDRLAKLRHGIEVPDPEKQYKQLKALEPTIEAMYAEGRITESKYRGYRASLEGWENA